jgi:hypothetical protein
MPFDSEYYSEPPDVVTIPTAPFIDLTKPSLPALAYLLRHEELWPEGFEYDWRTVKRCGMGLVMAVWPSYVSLTTTYAMVEVFGIDHSTALDIFINYTVHEPRKMADRIDRLTKVPTQCMTHMGSNGSNVGFVAFRKPSLLKRILNWMW